MAHLELDLEVNTAKFQQNLRNVENAAKDMVKKISKESEELDKALEAASERAKEIVESFDKLDDVAGESYKNMSNEAKALAKELESASATLAYITDMQNALNESFKAGAINEEDYSNSLGGLEALRQEVGRSIQSLTEQLNREAESMGLEKDSVEYLRLELTKLMGQLQTLTDEQKENGVGEVLADQINEVVGKLSETTGGIDDIVKSISTLGKELTNVFKSPAKAIENFPELFDGFMDSFKKLSKLVGNGVWKTLIKNFLATEEGALLAAAGVAAFALGLVAGGVAIVKYQKEIQDFLSVMFTGHKVLEDAEERLEAIRDATAEHSGDLAKEIVQLQTLSSAWAQLATEEEKGAFVKKYKSEFEALGLAIEDTTDAENAFSVGNTDKIIEALTLRTQATAAAEVAEKKLKEAIDNRIKAQKKTDKANAKEAQIQDNLDNGYASGIPDLVKQWSASINKWRAKHLSNAAEDLKNESAAYVSEMQNFKNQVKETLKELGLDMNSYDDQTAAFISNIKKMTDALQDAKDKNATFGLSGAALINKQLEQNIAAINGKYAGLLIDPSISNTQKENYSYLRSNEIEEAKKAAKNQLALYYAAEQNAVNSYETNLDNLYKSHAEERVRLIQDMQNSISQLKIDAMEDGNQKELAQIDLDWEQTKQKLEEQKKNYIDTIVKQQKEIFDAEENEKARKNNLYVKKTFDENKARKGVDTSMFGVLNNANSAKYQSQIKKFYDNLKKEYATYEQQIEEINKKYDDDIAAMKDKDGLFLAGFSEENVEEAEMLRAKALNNVEKQYSETYKKIFANIGSMNKAVLQETIALTKKELDKINPNENPDQYKEYFERLNELNNAYYSYDVQGFKSGFDGIAQQITKIINMEKLRNKLGDENTDEYKEQTKAIVVAKDQLKQMFVATGLTAFTDGLQLAANHMKQIAAFTGDIQLEKQAEALQAVAQNITAAGEGYASTGSWIGAVIAGVSDIINQAAASWGKADLYYAQLEYNMKNYQHELERLELQIKDSDYESIFGERPLAKAIEGYQKAQDALAKYQNAVTSSSSLSEKFADDTKSWTMLTNQSLKDYLSYLAGYSDLQATLVKTRDRSGIAEFFGASDEYTRLVDLAPQLWGEDGVFSAEKAKIFLQENQQLEQSVKDAIQAAIDYSEDYEAAVAAMDEYLGSVFGNIADSLTDAIWNGIENGTDAWSDFQSTASDTIKSVAKQMVKEMLVTSFMNDWTEKLRNAFGTGDNTQIMETFIAFLDSMETYIPDAQEKAQQLYDLINGRYGDTTEDTATAKGIAQASQDSVDELNGRFSAIQTHTFTINENVKLLTSNSGLIVDRLNAIAQHTSNLDAMREYLYRIESSTDKMATKGVTMLK